MIQLWEHTNGNVAMLVAGYGAVDTRNAAQVVANYGDYKANMKGTKVTVKKVNNQLTKLLHQQQFKGFKPFFSLLLLIF